MTSPWNRFEEALTTKGFSYEQIKGVADDHKIEELIRKYGNITDALEVAVVLTEFKKRQGNSFCNDFCCYFDAMIYSVRTY